MNTMEIAVAGDLFTTTGRDVFELVEIKRTFILKDLRSGKASEVDEDDPQIGLLVKIDIKPQMVAATTQISRKKVKIEKSSQAGKGEDMFKSKNGKVEAPGKKNSNSVNQCKSASDTNPYPGVSFNNKPPDRPWRGQFNKAPHYFSGQFASPKEARDTIIAKCKELGIEPPSRTFKKKRSEAPIGS